MSRRLLEDILEASTEIVVWTAYASLAEYEQSRLLRAAVERMLLIVGEALIRLERTDEPTAERIADHQAIIGLRHLLAH